MPFHHTVRGERFTFADLREVFARANEEKSGDALAGLAARSERERVAAKTVLADVRLGEIVDSPLIDPDPDEATVRAVLGHVPAFVFPLLPDGHLHHTLVGTRRQSFRKAWRRATRAAGVPGLLFHDLRRSAIRNLVRAGVAPQVAQTISGHKSASVFARYNIISTADRADAIKPLVRPGESMTDLALRFILSNYDVDVIIPGMRKPTHVRANVAASDTGPLDSRVLEALRPHRWDHTPTSWSQ